MKRICYLLATNLFFSYVTYQLFTSSTDYKFAIAYMGGAFAVAISVILDTAFWLTKELSKTTSEAFVEDITTGVKYSSVDDLLKELNKD